MRLCIIYNFAQKYREGIYRLFEKEYDCHWVFGNNSSDVKGLDTSILRSVETIENKYLIGPIYYQKGVFRLLKEYDSLLILGELFCISTWIVLLLRHTFMKQKRIYLWSHGWYGKEGQIKKVLKRWYFAMSDTTFLYGNYAQNIAKAQGYKKENLKVVHNSLHHELQIKLRQQQPSDLYQKHFNNSRPNVIFIGRLTPIKRLDLLLEALYLCKEKFNLTLIGDGENRELLQKKVTEFGIEDYVWFYGACYDENENARLIYNADLCVSPGNVGLTAIHAMTYGTPVITNNDFSWQMPEFEAIHEGKTGDFFNSGSATSMAQCIEQWFTTHANDRDAVRQACYAEIDNFWTPAFQMSIFKSSIL